MLSTALVVTRMIFAAGERQNFSWMSLKSSILELIGRHKGQPLSLSKLYRSNDPVWTHREVLQRTLFQRAVFSARDDRVLRLDNPTDVERVFRSKLNTQSDRS